LGFIATRRALATTALAAVSLFTVAATPVAAATPTSSTATAAVRVVRIAEAQRGKRYAYGASGPSAFDCSGLVQYSYRKAGVASRLGGGHSGYGMLAWGRAHHLFSRTAPQVGDVVIYGNGAHAAIYIGSGRVISALNPTQGIRITGLHALHLSVTGYVHTHLGRTTVSAAQPRPRTPAKATSSSATTAKVVRTRTFVNLRARATTASRALAVLRPGVALHVIGSTVRSAKRWDHVVYRGRSYWVRADLVRAG
jgi:hypothetical protein